MTSIEDRVAQGSFRFPDTIPFRGFFSPVRVEADVYDLEIDGTIPDDLDGAFYRAGADAQYPPREPDDIYINGDGMISMVRIRDGHAQLRTRYVRTERFRREREAHRSLYGSYRNPFTDDPSVAGTDRGTANTAVVWHGGRLLALKEDSRPIELDPLTLDTIGTHDFEGALQASTFTAHPKIDPETGQMLAFSYNGNGKTTTRVDLYEISPTGQITRAEFFEAPYASMMHDYLVTRDHIMFTIYPMICDWDRLQHQKQFFVWDPDQPVKVAIIPRKEGVAGMRWFTGPPACMETHSQNAYTVGNKLVADHFVAQSGWFSQFPETTVGPLREAPPILTRWTFDLDDPADRHDAQVLFEHPGDMPRVDPRFQGLQNRHAWHGSLILDLGPMPEFGPMGPPFNSLVHINHDTGAQTPWYAGQDSAPEEPVFVPRPGSSEEGAGYLISAVGRRKENRSDIVILDALDLGAGPIATLRVPFRLRYSFHGCWIPNEELPDRPGAR